MTGFLHHGCNFMVSTVPAPEELDRGSLAARDHRVVPNAGHSPFQEAPHGMAGRVAA
jgi:hypothetical protein